MNARMLRLRPAIMAAAVPLRSAGAITNTWQQTVARFHASAAAAGNRVIEM
jgi:hypothetical protein